MATVCNSTRATRRAIMFGALGAAAAATVAHIPVRANSQDLTPLPPIPPDWGPSRRGPFPHMHPDITALMDEAERRGLHPEHLTHARVAWNEPAELHFSGGEVISLEGARAR